MTDNDYLLNLVRRNILNSDDNKDYYDYIKSKWEALKTDNSRARELSARQLSQPNTAFIEDYETFNSWMSYMIDGYDCEFSKHQHNDLEFAEIEVSGILRRFEESIDEQQQAINYELQELEDYRRNGIFGDLDLREEFQAFDEYVRNFDFDNEDPEGPAPGGNANGQNPAPDSGNDSFDGPVNEEPESPPPSEFSEFDPVSGNEDCILKKNRPNVKKVESLFSDLKISQVAA